MKKINIFNKTISPLSDGKGCPVERGGVWELPRRTPCATPSWKEGERKVPSYRRMPVSRGFNRGGGIPFPWERGPAEQPEGMGITPSPLSPTKFLKFCGTRFGATPSWKEGERSGRGCLWFAALIALFVATPSFATPTELDKKTVASKAYVDTKQDLIDSGNVLLDNFDDNNVYVPSLVAYDSTTQTLKGNQIGILDWATLDTVGRVLDDYPDRDDLVPTVAAVSQVLTDMWNSMPQQWHALSWSVSSDNGANRTNAINAYNSTFGNGTNNWAGNSGDLINGQFLANSLALKQNKLPAKSTGNTAPKGNQAIVLNTAGNPSNVYTTAGKDLALTARSGAEKVMNYIDGTTASATFATSQFLTEAKVKSALVSLELLKDVYSELNSKITNNALPTGTTGTVVTYNGVNAKTGVQEFGERAVYDPANAYNAQNDATNLATMASVKYECAGYEAGHENDPDYCWLWALPN